MPKMRKLPERIAERVKVFIEEERREGPAEFEARPKQGIYVTRVRGHVLALVPGDDPRTWTARITKQPGVGESTESNSVKLVRDMPNSAAEGSVLRMALRAFLKRVEK